MRTIILGAPRLLVGKREEGSRNWVAAVRILQNEETIAAVSILSMIQSSMRTDCQFHLGLWEGHLHSKRSKH